MLRCLFASRGDDQFCVQHSVVVVAPRLLSCRLFELSQSADVCCILTRNRPRISFLQRCACKVAIYLFRSDESRGADRNVVNIVGSAQLAQKEHSGPGGLFENIAEGWCRLVQAHGAPHTWLLSQGELFT